MMPSASTTTATTTRLRSVPPGLAEWPVNPNGGRSLAPPYLPTVGIPATSDAVGSITDAGDGESVAYVQQWVDADAGAFFAIETLIPFVPNTPEEFRTNVDTRGWPTEWTDAFIARTGPGYVNLQLYENEAVGLVRLRSLNIEPEEIVQAASTMRRAGPSQSGWAIEDLPGGVVFVSEGDARNTQFREVKWSNGPGRPQAHLRITTIPDDLQIDWVPESAVEIADIGGNDAIVTTTDSTIVVRWSPEPGVLILAARIGTLDEGLAFARSVRPVDEAAWRAAAVESFGDYLTQCTGLFC
jgi:hypothetical protein